MRKRLMIMATVLAALMVVACGSWWVWRVFYSGYQLTAAMEANDEEEVLTLVRWGAYDDADDIVNGTTVLHWAAINGHVHVAELRLANGANVDAKGYYDGYTPLHKVAFRKNSAMAKLLLDNGADPNAKDRGGKTPLNYWPELAEFIKQMEGKKAAQKTPAPTEAP